ncbi:hypothetical protein Tco_0309625 [Tanacetum coccineum]
MHYRVAATLPSSSPPPENVESLKDNIRETMTTVDQGMSVEEIEQVIEPSEVAKAIRGNCHFMKTKTNMALSHKPDRTTIMQGSKKLTAKRKVEGNHNGNSEVSNSEVPKKCVDKKISTLAERQTENKRKFENTSRNSQNQQQQQIKRQNTGRAYTAGSGDKKPYGGSKPLCFKVAITTNDVFRVSKVLSMQQKDYLLWNWESRALRRGIAQRLKNKVIKKQIEGTRAHGVVHTLRGGETDQGPNNIKDGIEA